MTIAPLVLLFVLQSPSAAAAAAQPRGVEQQLLQLERELATTLSTRSKADMERILADAFVLRGAPDVSRGAWMDEALARCWGDRFEIDDYKAAVTGESATVSFMLTFFVNPDTCTPGVMRSLVTDVWTLDDGRWRLRTRHSSAPPAAGVASQFGLIPEVPPRWVVQSELSLIATGGNTSTRTTGLAGDLTRQTDRSASRLQATFVSSEADSVTQARATTVQARHGFKLKPTVEVFGRTAYARDLFAGITNRAALEGGFAVETGRPPRHRLTMEGALGLTSEERVAAATLRFATSTGAVRYVWQIRPGSELREEVALVADLTRGDNWRATNGLALSVAITRVLALKVSNTVEYRHLPVPGFLRADTRTAAALVVTLRRAP